MIADAWHYRMFETVNIKIAVISQISGCALPALNWCLPLLLVDGGGLGGTLGTVGFTMGLRARASGTLDTGRPHDGFRVSPVHHGTAHFQPLQDITLNALPVNIDIIIPPKFTCIHKLCCWENNLISYFRITSITAKIFNTPTSSTRLQIPLPIPQ